MQELIRGIRFFQGTSFKEKQALFERLASGQNPKFLFITCSDSRINPNLLMQTEPGDLFIIRNAGNLIQPYSSDYTGEAGTIEFALTALGIEEIIVCGHSHCGAMKGVLEPGTLKELPATAKWLSHADNTQRIMKENYAHLSGEPLLNACIQENVLAQIANLKTHPAVASRLAREKLEIHAWVYKFETGEVFAHHAEEGQFKLLTEEMKPSSSTRKLMSKL
jgi:carbonic anhydrase